MQTLRAKPVPPSEPLDSRLRAREPQWEGKDAEGDLNARRKEMIRTNERWQKSKAIAKAREKQAFEAAIKYRKLIPRGKWTDLEKEIAIEYELSPRGFSRKRRPHNPATKFDSRKSPKRSDQMAAPGNTAPTAPRAPTMTDRLLGSHMQTASSAFTNTARSERSDVFDRRLMGQITSRFQAGRVYPKAERIKIGQMLLQSLGLGAEDLISGNGAQPADDK